LVVTNVQGLKTDGTAVGNTFGQAGRVVVIGPQPLLEAWLSTNAHRMLTLYGNPGASYLMNYNTNLATTNWLSAWRVPLTNLSETFEADEKRAQIFYRAEEFSADPPILQLIPPVTTNLVLLLYGRSGTNYGIQTTAKLGAGTMWSPATNFTLTNSFRFIGVRNPTNGMMFFRAERP
jgi:hypothetical protein